MKTRFAIVLAVAGIVSFGAAAPTVLAATFSDDFSSGLRPTYWTVTQTTPGLFSVDDTHGDVRLAKVGNNPGGIQSVEIHLNMAAVGGPISGNFSMQIDFSNAVVGPNNDQLALNTYLSDGSPFDPTYDSLTCGSLNVHVWNGSVQGCTPVTGNSGTFTVARTGSTLTGSYNGSPIFSESNSSVVTGISFALQLQPGSNDSTSVTFDNFSLTAAGVASACTTPPPQMVSWWPGDGNANDIQDGNNGTLMNGVTFVSGLVAQAFHFDRNSSQFVQTSNAANLSFERTNPFTIDAWINTTETVHNMSIACKQANSDPFHGYGLFIDNDEVPACTLMNPPPPGAGVITGFLDGEISNSCPPDRYISVRGTTSLNDGQWHHVAMTYDGSSTAAGLKLYVDGAEETLLVESDDLGANTILSNAPFTIGSRENGGVPFNGDVDEVEVFNRVLSQPEIQAIVAAGAFGKCKGQLRATPTPRPRPTPAPRPTS